MSDPLPGNVWKVPFRVSLPEFEIRETVHLSGVIRGREFDCAEIICTDEVIFDDCGIRHCIVKGPCRVYARTRQVAYNIFTDNPLWLERAPGDTL